MEYISDPYKGTGRETRTDPFDRTSCWHLCNFECCGHDVTFRQSCRKSKQYCRLLLKLFARSGSKNVSPSLAEPSHQLFVLSENRIRRFIKFCFLRALACRHTHNDLKGHPKTYQLGTGSKHTTRSSELMEEGSVR